MQLVCTCMSCARVCACTRMCVSVCLCACLYAATDGPDGGHWAKVQKYFGIQGAITNMLLHNYHHTRGNY